MLKRFFISACILFTLCCGFSNPKSIELQGHIYGLKTNTPVQLFDFFTNKTIARTTIDRSGFFKLSFGAPKGIYRIKYGSENKDQADIIIEGNTSSLNISIETRNDIPRVKFTNSKINTNWQDYSFQRTKMYLKIELLSYFMKYYPNRKDLVYVDAENQRNKDISDYRKMKKSFVQKYSNTIIGEYVSSLTKKWFANNLNQSDKSLYIENIQNYWKDNTPTDNLNLTHTPYYHDLADDYLSIFYRAFSIKEAVPKLKAAVDLLIRRFGKKTATKKQIISALIVKLDGRSVLEGVLRYLDEKYIDATLVSGDQLINHTRRMARYRELQKGKLTPNISFRNNNGQLMTIRDINAKYTILVFWNSKCPHCTEQIPKLNKFLKTHPNYKALAISSDTDKFSYQNFIPQLSEMYHYCDFKGFETKPFEEYYVDGTPTIFMLDKNKLLIKKHGSIDRFLRAIQ